MELPVELREMISGDEAFIYNSWLKSYLDSIRELKIFKGLKNEVYYEGQHKKIEDLFHRCNTVIACSQEDKDQIYGWACYEETAQDTIIHFIYVKGPFRRMGIGTYLYTQITNEKPVWYTHESMFISAVAKKFGKITFNPYLSEKS